MEIERVNRTYGIYKSQTLTNVKKQEAVKAKDEVALSDTARDFQTILKKLQDIPDVRTEKVEQVKQQIASGNYNVRAEEVADKMLSQFDIKG